MTESELREDITRDVTQTMEMKVSELRELQESIAKRHRQEAAAADAKRQAADDERKRGQEAKLSELLQIQVETAEAGKARQVLFNRLLAALVTVMTAAAGGGIYFGTRTPTAEEAMVDQAPVLNRVSRESDQIERRVANNAAKIERLKDVAMEQQVQLSDSFEFVIQKLDTMSPRTADAVSRPPTLDEAKMKADAIKAQRKAQQRKAIESSADPFAGL